LVLAGCGSSLYVGSHLHLWTFSFIFWVVMVVEWTWVVVGIRHRVVVVIGGVIGLWFGGWLKKRTNVTCCDICIMFKFACEIITSMISHDDLRLVPWKSTRHSTEFHFFKESGQTLYRITRHNSKNTIPIIFHVDSTRMSNSMISPVEFWDSSQIPGGIPGGE